jgi:hypothetical protein
MTGGGLKTRSFAVSPVADHALMKTVHSTCPVAVLSMSGGGHPSGTFPASICVFVAKRQEGRLTVGGFYVTIRGLIFRSSLPMVFS